MGRHFVKLYADILRSSVWAESPGTRLLWITMLADADEQGIVRGDVHALARLANLSPAEVEAGLSVLTAPDANSHTEAEEGRRVVMLSPGRWRLVNYLSYREMRTPKQVAEAERKARYRARGHGGADSPVTGGTERDTSRVSREVSTSTSTSVPAVTKQQEKELVGRETDGLAATLAEAGLDLTDFDPHDRRVIEGALRSSRAPLARAVVLANALKQNPVLVVGRAFREFIASEQPWSTRLFNGFVRDAAKQIVRGDNAERAKRETGHIDREAVDRENAQREEAAVTELLADFEREHGDEFEQLQASAEAMVPKSLAATWRKPMVRTQLVKLIRERGDNGAH